MSKEGAEGEATSWQTKRTARGGPGNKTLVHLMRGVIKGGRRTKADGIKGNDSKSKIVHSRVISCIRVMWLLCSGFVSARDELFLQSSILLQTEGMRLTRNYGK